MPRRGQALQVLRWSELRNEADNQEDRDSNISGPSSDKVNPERGAGLPVPKNPFVPGPLISEPDEVIKVAVPLPPKLDQ
jgi:hypothetical protein